MLHQRVAVGVIADTRHKAHLRRISTQLGHSNCLVATLASTPREKGVSSDRFTYPSQPHRIRTCLRYSIGGGDEVHVGRTNYVDRWVHEKKNASTGN